MLYTVEYCCFVLHLLQLLETKVPVIILETFLARAVPAHE